LDGDLTEVMEADAASATSTGGCWHVRVMGPEVLACSVVPKKVLEKW